MAQNVNPTDGWGSPDTPAAHNVARTPNSKRRGRGEEPDDFDLLCSALKETQHDHLLFKTEYYTEKVKYTLTEQNSGCLWCTRVRVRPCRYGTGMIGT
jgi:hypothetical protein